MVRLSEVAATFGSSTIEGKGANNGLSQSSKGRCAVSHPREAQGRGQESVRRTQGRASKGAARGGARPPPPKTPRQKTLIGAVGPAFFERCPARHGVTRRLTRAACSDHEMPAS